MVMLKKDNDLQGAIDRYPPVRKYGIRKILKISFKEYSRQYSGKAEQR